MRSGSEPTPDLAAARRPTASCPACGGAGMAPFHECRATPVNSVLLIRRREDAVAFPRGDVVLGFCPDCQFVANLAFDPALARYGEGYDGTQRFSPTFDAFHRRLAQDLVDRHGLHGRTVMEIGCGQGEFLELLCTLGPNTGIGFDPAFDPGRGEIGAGTRVEVIADFYGPAHAHRRADFICCKQTLEHIHDPASFVGTVRRCLGTGADATVFFQVPDVTRILATAAFQDIYYEHCCYFGAASLARLFADAGFRVLRTRLDYDGQYVGVEARPADGPGSAPEPPTRLHGMVRTFAARCQAAVARWRRLVDAAAAGGGRTVLWGGGSKAVAFLNALGRDDAVDYVVDVNPHKHGTYLPGSGHPVLGPEALRDAPAATVIVMNPVYLDEVKALIRRIGPSPAPSLVTALS